MSERTETRETAEQIVYLSTVRTEPHRSELIDRLEAALLAERGRCVHSVDSEISNLEWRVVEAAVSCHEAGWAFLDNDPEFKLKFANLERSIHALIAAREKAEGSRNSPKVELLPPVMLADDDWQRADGNCLAPIHDEIETGDVPDGLPLDERVEKEQE